jgi:hypothetical protein
MVETKLYNRYMSEFKVSALEPVFINGACERDFNFKFHEGLSSYEVSTVASNGQSVSYSWQFLKDNGLVSVRYALDLYGLNNVGTIMETDFPGFIERSVLTNACDPKRSNIALWSEQICISPNGEGKLFVSLKSVILDGNIFKAIHRTSPNADASSVMHPMNLMPAVAFGIVIER